MSIFNGFASLKEAQDDFETIAMELRPEYMLVKNISLPHKPADEARVVSLWRNIVRSGEPIIIAIYSMNVKDKSWSYTFELTKGVKRDE